MLLLWPAIPRIKVSGSLDTTTLTNLHKRVRFVDIQACRKDILLWFRMQFFLALHMRFEMSGIRSPSNKIELLFIQPDTPMNAVSTFTVSIIIDLTRHMNVLHKIFINIYFSIENWVWISVCLEVRRFSWRRFVWVLELGSRPNLIPPRSNDF